MRSFTILAGVLSCALVALPTFVHAENPAFDQAVAAFRGGDYAEAVTGLEQLLEQTEVWPAGWLLLGQARFMAGDPDGAEAAIEKAVAIDPATDRYEAYWTSGQMLVRDRRYDEAIVPLEATLKLAADAKRPASRRLLAAAQFHAEQFAAARPTLEASLAIDGFSEDTAWLLALACQRLGDYDCAINQAQDVIAADGKRRDQALRNRARWSVFLAKRAPKGERQFSLFNVAVRHAKEWYEAQPSNADALELYASAMIDAGQSAKLADELAKHPAKDCRISLWLARALNDLERHPAAETAALAALACDPHSALAAVEAAFAQTGQLRAEHTNLVAVHKDQATARRALASLDAARAIDPAVYVRGRGLASELTVTLASLDAAAAAFESADNTFQADLANQQREQIRERCLRILWTRHSAPDKLTDEEQQFFKDNDCHTYR